MYKRKQGTKKERIRSVLTVFLTRIASHRLTVLYHRVYDLKCPTEIQNNLNLCVELCNGYTCPVLPSSHEFDELVIMEKLSSKPLPPAHFICLILYDPVTFLITEFLTDLSTDTALHVY